MVFPFYTAIYTAILGLLAALLTVNVIVNRVRAKVDVADGGVAALRGDPRPRKFCRTWATRCSAHRFCGGIRLPRADRQWTRWTLVVARLLSAWGLNASLKQTFGRQSGAGLTVLVTAAGALLILYAVVHTDPRPRGSRAVKVRLGRLGACECGVGVPSSSPSPPNKRLLQCINLRWHRAASGHSQPKRDVRCHVRFSR